MAKSTFAKSNDAKRHKDKYKDLTKEKKKELFQNIISRRKKQRKQRRAEEKSATQVVQSIESIAVETLINIKKEPDSNSKRSKNYRENKKVVDALLTMRKSRALRLKIDKPSYNEDVRAVEVDTPGMGKGVQAATDIPPASYICDYKGDILTSYKAVQKLLLEGNNKLLQIGNKQLWIDGQSPLNTLGSKFNHACNCGANCVLLLKMIKLTSILKLLPQAM